MDKQEVLREIREWSADPIDAPICMKISELIEENRPLGRFIMKMLECAENGEFK